MAAQTTRLAVPSAARTARRAELVFSGIDLAGPSFEGRVFLGNDAADEMTPTTPEHGYVGSFHVYAYGEPPPPEGAGSRATHTGPKMPIEKRLAADFSAQPHLFEGSDQVAVTVVPIATDPSAMLAGTVFRELELIVDPGDPKA